MNLVLLVAALAFAAISAALGFGHAPEYAADVGGWLALAFSLFAAAHLPFDRSQR